MIFTVRAKQVEIKAAKRFRLIPGGDFSVPGHVLMNWLGLVILIKPNPTMVAIPAPVNRETWKDYIVTLRDGQEYQVKATNEFHAGSVVVYGNFDGQRLAIDGRTGKPLGCAVKVHRDNIASVCLKAN